MSSTAPDAAEREGFGELDELAVNTIRFLAVDTVEKANSGHPGAPMGLAPLGYVLYSRIMRHNPSNPAWPNRDRFVLSNGHASTLQYVLLHLCGYDLSLDDLKSFRQWGSKCPGHPEYGQTPGIEVTTGPLGQGFANAVGFALAEAVLAERFNHEATEIVDHHTYMVCGDGDMQEGISSEAASLAGNFGLGKLIAIYDDNHVQLSGPTDQSFHENVGHRFTDYGWSVHELSKSASLEEIDAALREAQGVTDRPSLLVLPTHIGYGSPNKQDSFESHGSPLGPEETKATKENLDWPTDKPFWVPDEVAELFAQVKRDGAAAEEQWSERFEACAHDDADRAAQFERICKRHPAELPPLDEAPAFAPGDDPVATRAASGTALQWLAANVPELIGGDADLAPSTKTYLYDFPAIRHGDFGGRNIHFGVREHAMGAIVNALAIENMRAYGATFFNFSDYMRGAVRLAALMEIPSIFVYTHDSFYLGEDGPTHQPVEQLASLRAMPNLEVLRPADANETLRSWRWLLTRCSSPTALVLTRQKLPILDPDRIPDDAIERGAYVYDDADTEPELILIGTGSEVSTCIEAAKLLRGEGTAVRVVSVPCSERFLREDEAYRDEVLPPAVTARLSVEAGSSVGWHRFVREAGDSVAIDHFGASAPASVLEEKFGFTPEAVAERARKVLDG